MILLTFGLIKLWMEIVMDYERDFLIIWKVFAINIYVCVVTNDYVIKVNRR